MNMLSSKIIKEKQNQHLRFFQNLKVFQYQEIIKSKIKMNLIRINIKNMLLAVMVTNY